MDITHTAVTPRSIYGGSVSTNHCMKALLHSDDPRVGPSRMVVGEPDGRALQAFFRGCAEKPERGADLFFTTGLGLRPDEIPVRLPALIVPVLRTMERFTALGVATPTYLIYQATTFIAETNRIATAAAERTSARTMAFLKRYVAAKHPSIAAHVHFRNNADAQLDRAVLERLKRDLRARMADGSIPEDVLRQLAVYAQHNGAAEEAQLAYAAANILCNGALPSDYPFVGERYASASIVIPVGGKKEAPFFNLSRLYASTANGPRVAPMLLQVGAHPTYYAFRGGDILDAASCTRASIGALHPDLRRDFDVLAGDGTDADVLRTLYEFS